jgi:hypothetical protein
MLWRSMLGRGGDAAGAAGFDRQSRMSCCVVKGCIQGMFALPSQRASGPVNSMAGQHKLTCDRAALEGLHDVWVDDGLGLALPDAVVGLATACRDSRPC